jgi:hypothetical protein
MTSFPRAPWREKPGAAPARAATAGTYFPFRSTTGSSTCDGYSLLW